MSVVVLMYSKYSQACDKIIQMMNPVLDFRKICIDHDEVRKIVLKDRQKYQIENVPCILVFYANGGLNKYEGNEAFVWVKNTMETMRHIAEPAQPPMDPPSPLSVQENLLPSHHSIMMESLPSVPVEPVPLLPSKSPNEFLVVDEEKEPFVDMRRRMDSRPLVPPPVSKDQEKEKEIEPHHSQPEDQPIRGIKSDKQENLMSLAQLMQKERDKDEEIRNPNAINKINAV